jgi:hypothetical protein
MMVPMEMPFIPAGSIPGSPPGPVASRTERLLKAPTLPTLLQLAAPNLLNLLAIVFAAIVGGVLLYGVLTVCALLAIKTPFAAAQQGRESRSMHARA